MDEATDVYDFFDISQEIKIQKPIVWHLENEPNAEESMLYFEPKGLQTRSSNESRLVDDFVYKDETLRNSSDGILQICGIITPTSSKESGVTNNDSEQDEVFLVEGGAVPGVESNSVEEIASISPMSSNEISSTNDNSRDEDFVINSPAEISETDYSNSEVEFEGNDELLIGTQPLSERLHKQVSFKL